MSDPSLQRTLSEPLAASAPAGDAVAWQWRFQSGKWRSCGKDFYDYTLEMAREGNKEIEGRELYAHPPGPSEPSPSSRSETAGDWNAAIMAALNAVNDRRMREAGIFDEAHSDVKGESRLNALYDAFQDVRKLLRQAPSPDCSGCKPPGVQKEAHATKQSLSGADNSETETSGGGA